jgi:hypothetical protein
MAAGEATPEDRPRRADVDGQAATSRNDRRGDIGDLMSTPEGSRRGSVGEPRAESRRATLSCDLDRKESE